MLILLGITLIQNSRLAFQSPGYRPQQRSFGWVTSLAQGNQRLMRDVGKLTFEANWDEKVPSGSQVGTVLNKSIMKVAPAFGMRRV